MASSACDLTVDGLSVPEVPGMARTFGTESPSGFLFFRGKAQRFSADKQDGAVA